MARDDWDRMTEAVTICMCTFRREAAFDALASFARMDGIDARRITVVVVDNDETDALRPRFANLAADYPFALKYVHAPARNISIARNAALDAAQTRWIAFIDDDETADPHWLTRLMAARDGAAAVIGECRATYGPGLPDWAARCDFHSNRLGGDTANAYTSNALLDLDFARRHGLRFREELGRTGGEDTVFFRQMKEAGGRIVSAPAALVYEPVPPTRATMRWVRTRMFRAGQTHGLVTREFDPAAWRWLAPTAGAKMAFSSAMAVVSIPGTTRSRRWLARATLHAGALSYRIRPGLLEEYA